MSTEPLRLLVDIGHPAHVHLFRNAICIWMGSGHQVIITARDKDITTQLLSAYGLDYHIASKARKGQAGLFIELLEHDWSVLKMARRYESEILLGTSVAIAHVSRVLPAHSIVFNEDDMQSARTFAHLTYPFADVIVTPAVLPDDLGKKHIRYAGYQELAYLHPSRFTPNRAILSELGADCDEPYSILRFVSFQAAHDRGQKGISTEIKRALVKLLSQHGRVFITAEGKLPDEFAQYQIRIQPHKIHDALAFASIFVGDSQSMTIEAAVLGTPSVRCNTFVGRCPVIEELEQRYGLTYGFLPRNEKKMLEKVKALINTPDLRQEWRSRRDRMLRDKIDLTAWMVGFVEHYPQSLHEYRERVSEAAV